MKKLLLGAVLCAGVAFGDAFSDNIVKLIAEQTGEKVKVESVLNLASTKQVKFVLVSNEAGSKLPVFASSDGKAIFGASNIFFGANLNDSSKIANKLKEAANSQMPTKEAMAAFFEGLSARDYVVVKGKGSGVEYIVADPNCGACQNVIANIEKHLDKGEVRLVLVGFLGQDSAVKSTMLRSELKNKSTAEQVKLLKQVFKPTYKINNRYKSADLAEVMNINDRVVSAGIKSVPYHFIVK